MTTKLMRIVALVGVGLWCGCSDELPPVADAAPDVAPKRDGTSDAPPADGLPADAEDDRTIRDTVPPDTTGDGRPSDTTHDGIMDTVSPDTTADAPNPCAGQNLTVDLDNNNVPDCQENLLMNGQFRANVAGWMPGGNTNAIVWNSMDAQGSSGSGSARVVNMSPNANPNVNGATQCLRLSGAKTYTLSAQFFIPSGQQGQPGASLQAVAYPVNNCLGTGTVNNSPTSTSPFNTWTLMTYTFSVPATTNSVRIRINSSKNNTTNNVSVQWDNVFLK